MKCGRWEALAILLSDVRWTVRRVEVGGWVGLKTDFELLLTCNSYAEFADMREVSKVLERNWSEVSRDERLLAYCIQKNLTEEQRRKKYIALYIDRMIMRLSLPLPSPRLKLLGLQDSREVSVLPHSSNSCLSHMHFSPSSGKAIVGNIENISVRSVSAQKELCSIQIWPIIGTCSIGCVAISADGSLIVSGHSNGTFQQWDEGGGGSVGVLIDSHSDNVTCIAISKDNSTIIARSDDKTLDLWDAKNCTPKGRAMINRNEVACVASCEGKSMIVSGSRDKTVML